MNLKQVILVRQDLKLPKGKLAAQVAHASVEAILKSHPDIIEDWRREGMKKIILKVKDKEELLLYKREAEDNRLVAALISDAGRTVIEPGTITCLGIVPDKEDKIDKITWILKLI